MYEEGEQCTNSLLKHQMKLLNRGIEDKRRPIIGPDIHLNFSLCFPDLSYLVNPSFLSVLQSYKLELDGKPLEQAIQQIQIEVILTEIWPLLKRPKQSNNLPAHGVWRLVPFLGLRLGLHLKIWVEAGWT